MFAVGDRVRCINNTPFRGLEGTIVDESDWDSPYRWVIRWDSSPNGWRDHGGNWSDNNIEKVKAGPEQIEDWRL